MTTGRINQVAISSPWLLGHFRVLCSVGQFESFWTFRMLIVSY